MIRQLSLCFGFILLVLTSTTFGQTKKPPAVNLANTTWQLYQKETARDSWEEGEKLTFLSGGKIKVNGQTYPRTTWRVKGTKLTFSYSDDSAGMFGSGDVTVNGNHANGGGRLGMRGTPFILRLTKLS